MSVSVSKLRGWDSLDYYGLTSDVSGTPVSRGSIHGIRSILIMYEQIYYHHHNGIRCMFPTHVWSTINEIHGSYEQVGPSWNSGGPYSCLRAAWANMLVSMW